MKASQIPVAPAKVLRLDPSAFAQTWDKAPTKGIAVGLRTISDGEESTARAEAEQMVREEYQHEDPDNAADCFNDALMRCIVARAICDPNDAKAQHPIIRRPDETLRFMLKSETVRWLFEELERVQVETGPLHAEAGPDDVSELIGLLALGEPLKALDSRSRSRVLRHLSYALEDLRPDQPTDSDPDSLH